MKKQDLTKEKLRLASRLYQIRNELGIKQTELQQEGIISQSHLSKIENGEINISAIMPQYVALCAAAERLMELESVGKRPKARTDGEVVYEKMEGAGGG